MRLALSATPTRFARSILLSRLRPRLPPQKSEFPTRLLRPDIDVARGPSRHISSSLRPAPRSTRAQVQPPEPLRRALYRQETPISAETSLPSAAVQSAACDPPAQSPPPQPSSSLVSVSSVSNLCALCVSPAFSSLRISAHSAPLRHLSLCCACQRRMKDLE